MATPEFEPQAPQELVQQVETRFEPEVERQLNEVGAQVQPQAPTGVQDLQGQPIAQPVGVMPPAQSNTKTVSVAASQDQATTWSHGDPNDSQTWFGLSVLRQIKKALHFGWRVVLKQQPAQ